MKREKDEFGNKPSNSLIRTKKKSQPDEGLVDIQVKESFIFKIKDFFTDIYNNFKHHKSPGEKPPSKFKPRYVFIALVIVCIVLIIGSSVSSVVAEPFKAISSILIVPAQKGINSIGKFFSDKFELMEEIDRITDERDDLEDEVQKLKEINNTLRNQSAELVRLQELVELKDMYADYPSVAANIISKDSSKWFATFTVDKGSADGIKTDMNVIADGGLVGIVTEVGINYSKVRAIIDDESAVSAQFQDSTELCIVSGNLMLMEDNLLEFSNVNVTMDLKKDLAIITSRVSSKFLPGILIGYVTDYTTDPSELTKSGTLTPVVDFTNLNEVLIITELKTDWDAENSEDNANQNETETVTETETESETETVTETTTEN